MNFESTQTEMRPYNLSTVLRDIIACPICHSTKIVETLGSKETCPSCSTRFESEDGALSFIPCEFSEDSMQDLRETWARLQQNGLESYTVAPEFNLSVEGRPDALAFASFAQFSGLVLDIGCGPRLTLPSYFSLAQSATVVGVDPLNGSTTRNFPFARAIGEYLPFCDSTFDHISFASSLDHCLNPQKALAEAKRCLKEDGLLNLWIDGISDHAHDEHAQGGFLAIAAKGWKSLSRHNWIGRIGFRRTFQFIAAVAKMKVPEGATDPFHLGHFSIDEVLVWLEQLGFKIEKNEPHREFESVFIQARPKK